MIRENITLLFIVVCLISLSGFILTWAGVVWRRGVSRMPTWMWMGIAVFALYAAFCAPVFCNSTLENQLWFESGTYARAYWFVNKPARALIYLLAYRGRHNLIDAYLFMPRYVVCVGGALTCSPETGPFPE